MTDKAYTRTSRFLSLILRHEPERVGLKLGEAGWVGVDALLQAVNRHGVWLVDHVPPEFIDLPRT